MEECSGVARVAGLSPAPLGCGVSLHWSLCWLAQQNSNNKKEASGNIFKKWFQHNNNKATSTTASMTSKPTHNKPLSPEHDMDDDVAVLPVEIITVVGSFCDPLTLFQSFLLVCRQWSEILLDDRIWHKAARHTFGGTKQWYDASLTWKQWCQAQCIMAWSFTRRSSGPVAKNNDTCGSIREMLLWAAASGHSQLFKNKVLEHGIDNRELLNLTYVYAAMIGSVEIARFLIERNLVDACAWFSLDDRSHAVYSHFTGHIISNYNNDSYIREVTVGEYTTAQIALGLGHEELLDYLVNKQHVPMTSLREGDEKAEMPLTLSYASLALSSHLKLSLPAIEQPIDLIALIHQWADQRSSSRPSTELLSMYCQLAANKHAIVERPVSWRLAMLSCCLHQRYDGAHVLIQHFQDNNNNSSSNQLHHQWSLPTVDWSAEDCQFRAILEQSAQASDNERGNMSLRLGKLPGLSLVQVVLLLSNTECDSAAVLQPTLYDIAGRQPVELMGYLLGYYLHCCGDDAPQTKSKQQQVVRVVLSWIRMYPMDFASMEMRSMLAHLIENLDSHDKQPIANFLQGSHEPYDFAEAWKEQYPTSQFVSPEQRAALACFNIKANTNNTNKTKGEKIAKKPAKRKAIKSSSSLLGTAQLADGSFFVKTTVNLFDYPPRVVAEQLTLFQLDIMLKIHPREFFEMALGQG
eukprot:TRINITY_DN1859_c2_g1_i2.p1 TRINITY_DN1859_c2_g1~~TRINITY_DN1859_c2_g1_i2.p1  ORF type:complete len:691 (+),score=108.50 TRINITY_DN1859_c2_g1_i2:3-2075(+)